MAAVLGSVVPSGALVSTAALVPVGVVMPIVVPIPTVVVVQVVYGMVVTSALGLKIVATLDHRKSAARGC